MFSEFAGKHDPKDINGSGKQRSHARHDRLPALIDQAEIDESYDPAPVSRLRKWIASVTGR